MLTGSRQPAISPQRGQDQNIESYRYQSCVMTTRRLPFGQLWGTLQEILEDEKSNLALESYCI